PDAEALPEAEVPLNTVTFTEVDGRTTLTLLVETTTKELRDVIINSGMELGMQEQMELLEQIAISLH
ncbi:MAG TPA: ATPase, partial [Pseudonocardiaceae bacterium]